MERRFAAPVFGIYILDSISMEKRFCARSWACRFWTDWHSVVMHQFERFRCESDRDQSCRLDDTM